MFIRELLGEAKGADQKSAKGADYKNDDKTGDGARRDSNAASRAHNEHESNVAELKKARKEKASNVLELVAKVKTSQAAKDKASGIAGASGARKSEARKEQASIKQKKYEKENGVETPESRAEMKGVAKKIDDRKAAQAEERREKAKAEAKKSNAKSTNESKKPSPLTRFLAEIAQKPKAPLGDRGKAVNAKAAAAKAQNKDAEKAYNAISKVGKKGDDASDEDNADMKAAQNKLKNMPSADTKARVKGKPQEKQEANQAKRAIAAKKEEEHEAAMTGPADD